MERTTEAFRAAVWQVRENVRDEHWDFSRFFVDDPAETCGCAAFHYSRMRRWDSASAALALFNGDEKELCHEVAVDGGVPIRFSTEEGKMLSRSTWLAAAEALIQRQDEATSAAEIDAEAVSV